MNQHSKLFSAIKYLFLGYLSIVFIGMIFIDENLDYYSVIQQFKLSNWLLLLSVLLFASGYYFLYRKLGTKKLKHFKRFLIIYFLSFLVIQIILSYNLYFYTDWDVKNLMYLSDRINAGTNINNLHYLQTYPNNAFLAWTFALLKRVFTSIGLDSYRGLIYLGNLITSLSIILTALVVKKLSKSDFWTISALILGSIIIGLSPWITIPYSDAYGTIFPILIIYLEISIEDPKKRIPLVTLVTALGYLIKPTVVIVLIAIIIIRGILLFRSKPKFKKVISSFGIVVAIVISLWGFKNLTYFAIGFKVDKESEFSMTHYLMMGLNEDSNGGYSGADFRFSAYYLNAEERRQAEITETIKRLKDYGGDYPEFLLKKSMSVYNDGTFFWSGEGTFDDGSYTYFYQDPSGINNSLSEVLHEFYWYNENNYAIFVNIAQALWLFTLLGILGNWLGKPNKKETLIMLSLLGLSLFLLLFEQRSRYLYLYLPLFIVLSINGWRKLFSFAGKSDNADAL